MFTRASVYAGAPAALVAVPVYALSGDPAGTAALAAAAVLGAAAAAPALHRRAGKRRRRRELAKLARAVTAASARVADAPTRAALERACAAILGIVEDDRVAGIPAATDMWVLRERLHNVGVGLDRYLYFQDRPDPAARAAAAAFRELAPAFAAEMERARTSLVDDRLLQFHTAIEQMRLETGPYLPEGDR